MSIHRKLGVAVVAVLTAGLAACGGGGYDGGDTPPPPPAKQAPQIVGLANQTLPQDTSTPVLTFQVSDADSGVNAVTVTATSSDPTIIPAAGSRARRQRRRIARCRSLRLRRCSATR